MCPWGAPAPVYKGAREEEAGPRRGRTKCGVLLALPSPSRIPPPIWNRKRGREKDKEGAPPFPSPIRTRPRGGVRPPLRPFSFFPVWPNKAQYSSPYSRNSPVPPKIPESLGTFPMSEYSRPIYRSLRLDHFETPCHVRDLIRDFELLWYIKTYKLIMKLSSKP